MHGFGGELCTVSIQSPIQLIDQATQLDQRNDRLTGLNLARSEIENAIEVLEGGDLHFDDAVPLFNQADLLAVLPLTMSLAKETATGACDYDKSIILHVRTFVQGSNENIHGRSIFKANSGRVAVRRG